MASSSAGAVDAHERPPDPHSHGPAARDVAAPPSKPPPPPASPATAVDASSGPGPASVSEPYTSSTSGNPNPSGSRDDKPGEAPASAIDAMSDAQNLDEDPSGPKPNPQHQHQDQHQDQNQPNPENQTQHSSMRQSSVPVQKESTSQPDTTMATTLQNSGPPLQPEPQSEPRHTTPPASSNHMEPPTSQTHTEQRNDQTQPYFQPPAHVQPDPGLNWQSNGNSEPPPQHLVNAAISKLAPSGLPGNEAKFWSRKFKHPGPMAAPESPFLAMLDPLQSNSGLRPSPTTVTPTQMHLDPPTLDVDPSQITHEAILVKRAENDAQAALANPRPPSGTIASFARLKFADSTYHMSTLCVILGRDRAAMKEMVRRIEKQESLGLEYHPPDEQDQKFNKTYVSVEGGILGPEYGRQDSETASKRRKASSASSSAARFQGDSDDEVADHERQYISHTPGGTPGGTPGPATLDDVAHLNSVAFVGIHPPGPNMVEKCKGISRRHLKISYNKRGCVFEATPLHSNGFFLNDVHQNSVVTLHSGDEIQIRDISFRFFLNGVKGGFTGAEDSIPKAKMSGGGKEMSFDFEQARDNGYTQDTSDELSSVEAEDLDGVDESTMLPRQPLSVDSYGADGIPPADGAEGSAASGVAGPSGQPAFDIPKKRGPGRPPKNGIMSKRQQRELKKAQQELARQQAAQEPAIEPPAKRKVGRPRKHPLPEGELPPEKRKYKPRKSRDEDGGGEGSDPEKPAKEKKGKIARPKSPPLELRKEDYTEQQLQKPNKNYSVLIDETLTAAPDGLTLKQIYKRIALKYPWFYFHTETKGWESSVRHNLIGNEAFKKEGETGLWKRVPGVELDAGKRRKPTSPERTTGPSQIAYGAQGFPYNQGQLQQQQQQQHPMHPQQPMAPGHPGQHPGYAPGQQQLPQGFAMSNYNQQNPGQQPQQPPQQFPPPGQPPNAMASAAGTAQQSPTFNRQQQQPAAPARPTPALQFNQTPHSYAQQSQAGASTSAQGAAAAAGHAAGQPGNTGSVPQPTGMPGAPSTPGAAAARPSQTPQPQTPTAGASTPQIRLIDPAILFQLNALRQRLIQSLTQAQTPRAVDVVWSAIDRLVGLRQSPSGTNTSLEETCYQGLVSVIRKIREQGTPTPTPDTAGGASTPGALPAPVNNTDILRPDVARHIEGIRNQFVNTIKQKLGEEDATTLVHSAIMRTLGLATESRLAGRAVTYDTLEAAIMENFKNVANQLGLQPMN